MSFGFVAGGTVAQTRSSITDANVYQDDVGEAVKSFLLDKVVPADEVTSGKWTARYDVSVSGHHDSTGTVTLLVKVGTSWVENTGDDSEGTRP